MIKLPFNLKPGEQEAVHPSGVFAEYCREELERLRDLGGAFDEARFQAAMDLAMSRLRALEDEDKP